MTAWTLFACDSTVRAQVADSFNPGSVSNVAIATVAVQPDAKILVGGLIHVLAGALRDDIGRLNSDGTADAFNPSSIDSPLALAVQPDGKILVGMFGNGLLRLNGDGTVDRGFTSAWTGTVHALALQPDGKILVGGDGMPAESATTSLD